MSDQDTPAVADDQPNNEPAADALEGTTPEEVAGVLRSSGINLPEATPATDDEEGDDPDADEADKPDEPDTPEADEDPADDDEEEDPAEPAKPAEVKTDDPAEADKYSFEVTDANDVTFKISVGAKMEDILSEFQPRNNGQILDILNQLQKLEGQKSADEAKAAEDKSAQERRTRASELLESWGEEAKALQGAKRIAEGEDGDKRIAEVYKYMADENDKRIKASKPTINTFEDALDKLEAKETRDKAAADAKAAKETARKNGGKVGGASAPASGDSPVYKAGSARNANQALRSMGIL